MTFGLTFNLRRIIARLAIFAIIALIALPVLAQVAATMPLAPSDADALAVLTTLGLGHYAASMIALAGLVGYVLAHLLAWGWLPAPAAGATGVWPALYAVLSWIAGNYGKAANVVTKMVLLSFAVSLSACQTGANTLVTAGASPATAAQIAADTAAAGQLFCQYGTTLLAVAGVNVKGATSHAVAQACAAAQAVGALTPPTTTPVPVAAPAGAVALLATVPDVVAAAVKLSQGV